MATALVGSVEAVYVATRGAIETYCNHAIEMVSAFLGHEVERAEARRRANRDTVNLEFATGETATVEMIHLLRSQSYGALLYGPRGHYYVELKNFDQPFIALIEAFVATARGAPPPVLPKISLRQLEIVLAVRKSLETGQPVSLAAGSGTVR
jgi:predicted dehydrogenase